MIPSRILWCLLAVALPSCAVNHVPFRPREQVSAESPEGHPAAQYALEDGGQIIGQLRVWSDGVIRTEDKRCWVNIGLELENNSRSPLRFVLDHTRLEAIVTRSARGNLDRVDRPEVFGELEVAAETLGKLELDFPLPAGIAPRQVSSFALRWTLHATGTGTDFRDLTPFLRDRRDYAPDYSPSWFWGWGWPFSHFGSRCW